MELGIQITKAGYKRKTVLGNICFTAKSGTFTAVIGRNGSGKSTLLSCIAGLLPYEGTITADGTDLASLSRRERAANIAVMLQLTRAPHVPVEELVAFGRAPYHSGIGDSLTAADREAVENAIREAELENLRRCYVDRISGGEQKRAYFGMMLAQDAPVLLLDESTAFMDADHESRFLTKIAALKGKKTIIAVMHDLSHALRTADRVVLLDGGTVRFSGSAEEILETTLIEEVFRVRRYTAADDCGGREIFFR